MHTLARLLPTLLLAALTLLPASTVRAQPADGAPLPDAASLFEAHITAIGGRANIEKHHSRILHGVYRVAETTEVQILTIYAAGPNSLRAELEAPGLGTTIRSTDGSTVWGTNLNGSPFAITERDRDETLDSAAFQGEAAYQTQYSSIKTVGSSTIENRPAYRVDFVTARGLEGAVYFDAETDLVCARQLFPVQGSDANILVAVSDYKDFEGVLLPTVQRQLLGDGLKPAVEIEFRWVEVNPEQLPEFSPPTNLGTDPGADAGQ